MFWSSVFISLLTLRLQVAASPVSLDDDSFQLKHNWAQVPNGWELHSEPPADHVLNLRIGLKESNIDELVRQLYQVSDPTHPRYGQHLSKAQVDALVAPRPETLTAVDAWLLSHDIDPAGCTRTTARDWLHVAVPVAQAERMFNTRYRVFRHAASGEFAVRALAWSLPRAVHSHIDVAEPTTMFGRLRGMRATSFLQPGTPVGSPADSEFKNLAAPPSSCNNVTTPSCLRTLYNTINYNPTAADINTIGVAGYLGDIANFDDLQTFFNQFRTDAVGANFTVVQVNGGDNNQTQLSIEGNLDIQYTESMTFPTPNVYYSTGGSPPYIPDNATTANTNEPYLDWLNFILNQTTIPQTFSTSYGDDEQTVPFDFATRVCNGFAQLGVRGASVMFSSGDWGVGAGSCQTNDGTNVVRFQPAFPASCPFVTTVGGTYLINPEIAVSFSGGGFSNVFARPAYQDTAVTAYLQYLGTTNQGLFNVSGRAYPDVAAQGQGFQVVIEGSVYSIGGTSASCPTFAGVVALLNDFRLSNNEPSLGFLNPLIYSATTGFNDITSGNNPGCGTNGFTATTGWDPVTGLGTPDFLQLQTLLG